MHDHMPGDCGHANTFLIKRQAQDKREGENFVDIQFLSCRRPRSVVALQYLILTQPP